jgi:hypothetical protein
LLSIWLLLAAVAVDMTDQEALVLVVIDLLLLL